MQHDEPDKDENRSPRALPLPPAETAPEVIPRDQRESIFGRSKPRVLLGYQNAKRHYARR
jgi:hypothetical protein